MTTNKGFKQTEIGTIPEDWEVVEFGEICHPSKSRINPIISNTSYKCVELEHLAQVNGILLGYADSNNLLSQKSVFEKGDVLFGKLRPYLRKYLFAEFDGVCTTEIWVLKSEINVKNKFLYYLVQSDKIIEAANISIGTKMPRAEWKTVSETLIPLPTLAEQTAIATALSDMDALITQTDRLIQKKKAIKQGLMQELLSPKEGWEKIKLGDAIKVSRGGSPRPIQNYLTSDPNGINWIKIGDTSPTSKYITSTNDKIIAEGVISSRQVFVGDFLLSNSMSFGRPYILKIDGCIHDGWLVLQDYQTIFNRDFLYYFLSSSYVLNQYKNLAAGSSVLNLNKDIVEKVFLEKPASIEEQVEIASILSLIDEEITLLETKRAKLHAQKQGMMQVLLTGKIRLNP